MLESLLNTDSASMSTLGLPPVLVLCPCIALYLPHLESIKQLHSALLTRKISRSVCLLCYQDPIGTAINHFPLLRYHLPCACPLVRGDFGPLPKVRRSLYTSPQIPRCSFVSHAITSACAALAIILLIVQGALYAAHFFVICSSWPPILSCRFASKKQTSGSICSLSWLSM